MSKSIAVGYTMGLRFPVQNKLFVDSDLGNYTVDNEKLFKAEEGIKNQFMLQWRLITGFKLLEKLSIFVGAGQNYAFDHDKNINEGKSEPMFLAVYNCFKKYLRGKQIMKVNSKNLIKAIPYFVLFLFLMGKTNNALAQQIFGLSFGYEYFPSVELVDPSTGAEDLEIEASSWNLGAAFPLAFAKGEILVMNQINYKRTDFSYRNFPPGGEKIDQIHTVGYTFFMIDSLSKKWKMVAVATPGLASDFEGDVSSDDFTFGAVFGFIRKISKKFQLGFGIAYMPDFGEPLPLPFLYVDWKIAPKLNANGILPTNMMIAYKLNPKIDLGFALKVAGNRYHGDPDKFGVDNPLLKYSEGTISPLVQIHLLNWIHLNIEGGFAFFRKFEFFDGDEKAQSFDLKQTVYLRTGLVLGF